MRHALNSCFYKKKRHVESQVIIHNAMLRNLYNTSRDVTPPSPPLALLRPPHQLLNARGSLWVSQSVSQSVRASDDGSWASPCPHARSEGAHKAQDRLWDLLLGARQHLDYKTRFFFFFFYICCCFFSLTRLLGLRNNLQSCLGLQRMWASLLKVHTRWVKSHSK